MEENSTEMEFTGDSADLVYAFAAAPGASAGQSGLCFAATNSGLRRSLDGGQTWADALETLELSEPLPVTSLALSPVFDKEMRVLAGTTGGFFLSTNGGESWKALLLPNPPPTVSSLAISPNFEADETIFAGTMEDGVYISRDGGERWVAWNFGLLDLNVICLAASPRFAGDETVLAGTETGIFRSTNGGRAWREVEMPFGFDPVLSLAFAAGGKEQTIFAGTENNGLWVSRDEGESWSRLAEDSITDPVNSVLVSGEDVLVVTGSALWRSADLGATWQDSTPEALREAEIAALLAPEGLAPGAALLAALTDGSITALQFA